MTKLPFYLAALFIILSCEDDYDESQASISEDLNYGLEEIPQTERYTDYGENAFIKRLTRLFPLFL